MQVQSSDRAVLDSVLWDVVEEHLDEADFLFGLWTAALDSPVVGLEEVRKGVEARFFAHVDGLLVNGPAVVSRLLEPAFFAPEPSTVARVAVAGIALLGHGRQDLVAKGLLGNDQLVSDGARCALELAASVQFDEWLRRALSSGGLAAGRVALLRTAEARRLVVSDLMPFLHSGDAAEVAAAAAAARWSDTSRHLHALESLFHHSDDKVAHEAMVSALVHGSDAALAHCFARASDPLRVHAFAMLLIALLGSGVQQEMLVAHLARETHRRAALFALGYSGQVAVVPALLPLLESQDPETAKLAAEAIDTITGLDTADDEFTRSERMPDVESLPPLEQDLAADLASSPLDRMALPNTAAIVAWWRARGGALDPRRRTLLGASWTVEAVASALERLPMRRRHPLALWLLLRSRGKIRVDSRAFGRTQRSQVAALAALDTSGTMRRSERS